MPRPSRRSVVSIVPVIGLALCFAAGATEVAIQRLKGEGKRYVQAVTDAAGNAHLIYVHGDPRSADLYYLRHAADSDSLSAPLQVNSQAGSVVVMGTVRGPRLAVGPDGTVHVAWMGSQQATPRGPENGAPMLYSRLPPGAAAFSAQVNVALKAGYLDGGGTVAAGPDGRVYVVWHGGAAVEAKRRVYVAESQDHGATFAAGRAVGAPGVCSCCGMEATVGLDARLAIVYRSATARGGRDARLLHAGATPDAAYDDQLLSAWQLTGCPMSTAAITPGPQGNAIAWEHEARIELRLPNGLPVIVADLGAGRMKHPALARNATGQWLVVAAEGTGWNQGGRVVWALLSPDGKRLDGGRVPGLAANARPAAYVRPDGNFVVAY